MRTLLVYYGPELLAIVAVTSLTWGLFLTLDMLWHIMTYLMHRWRDK